MTLGNGKKPTLKPAIVVGDGGTGNQVVRRVKKLVQDQYGDTPTLLNFVVIDTDEDSFNDQSWAPLPPLNDIEQAPLYDPQVPFSDVRDNPGAYPEIHDWLPPSVDVGLLDRQDGAGQVRMLGRLAYYKAFEFVARRINHFFDQCQRIQTLLEAMQRYDFNVESDPVVYLISSVCGGQGAGSFIDLAVALRVLAAGRFPRLNLIGVLTLPSVYADIIPRENWSKVCANAHAAIKEMDYLMHNVDRSRMRFRFPAPIGRTITPQTPLFDLCYIVDNRHHRGSLNNQDEVFDQIAAQLFLEIGTPFGARSDSIRVNLNTVAGIERDRVYNTGRRYSGFGNHTISFDREKIVALASLQSTHDLVEQRLLGAEPAPTGVDEAAVDFLRRYRISGADASELLNSLVPGREISQQLATASYSEQRPDHSVFARDLWARFDAFWLRRAQEIRVHIERQSRLMLDGSTQQPGILPALDETVNEAVLTGGVAAAHRFAEALLTSVRAVEASMRARTEAERLQAQRLFEETEQARDAILSVGRELDRLRSDAQPTGILSRLLRLFGFIATLGLWRPGAALEEHRTRQLHELNIQAQEYRNRFLSRHNQAVQHRLAQETCDVAANIYSEATARLLAFTERLRLLKGDLEQSSRALLGELTDARADLSRTAFINGNTMRRDISADYVDRYLEVRGRGVAEQVLRQLLPETSPPLDALEASHSHQEIRAKFHALYAHDVLDRSDRDSLADLIDRLHSDNGGGLTDRIKEGLQFCLPFWDIRVPGNQFTTEVLMVGLKQNHPAVEDYLASHAAAQRGEVLPQVVPTGQDSAILISRIAHGASYYWHAQDESYFREYSQAVTTAPYPIHLREDWRALPEPIPDPRKYERRVFALGIAYEFIAVRGAAYYLDPDRRYSLAGTSRQDSPDWKTIPLSESTPPGPSKPPALPASEDRLDEYSRAEAMQKFVDAVTLAAAVREKLMAVFNQQGREATRKQVECYCVEVLQPAVGELDQQDAARHQLEAELAELQDLADELKPAAGVLRLGR
jgi:hypothetical protein